MTEGQALESFKEAVKDSGLLESNDRPAIAQEWSFYIDHLVRDGQVAEEDTCQWGNPWGFKKK